MSFTVFLLVRDWNVNIQWLKTVSIFKSSECFADYAQNNHTGARGMHTHPLQGDKLSLSQMRGQTIYETNM